MDELDIAVGTAEDDYMLQQLKEAVLRRQASMDRIKQIYKDDPRAKMTPFDRGLEEFVSRPSAGGRGTESYAPLFNGMQKQREFLHQNKLQPELLQQKFDETDPFTDTLRRVVSAKAEKNDGWQLTHSADGGIQRTHVATGKVEHLMSGTLYAKQKEALAGRFYEQLAKEQSGASPEEMRMAAENMAERTIVRRLNSATGTPTSIGIPLPVGSGQRQPPGSALATERTVGEPVPLTGKSIDIAINDLVSRQRDLEMQLKSGKIDKATFDKRKLVLAEEYRRLAPEGSGYHIRDIVPPGQPVSGKTAAPVVSAIENQPTRTPREIEADKTRGEKEFTGYESAKQTIGALRSANLSLAPMEAILISGKNTSGQLHETLNKVGGYLNYIDPDNSLAQSAGNDAVYFANLMNLVRDKIKALGAGTAVSNLDLIVSQKSLGDLRNTPEGNLKLIGIMKLMNATEAEWAQGKVDYYDNNRDTFKGHKTPNGSRYAIRARRNPYKDGTIMSYDIQSKADWIKEQLRRNPGKDIPQDVLDREWERFAADSVKAMFK